ncbi:MAG: dodecin family protein [Acidimicrobiia bacterium]|nr:dodecin family protein [Acidimicrobiia bacterium]
MTTGSNNDSSAHGEHTYRVIRLVGSSPDSWEDAARNGVVEAAKTITHLEYARVTDLDTVIRQSGDTFYRLELEVAFQVDRSRPSPVRGEPDVTVKRYLIVANETLARDKIPKLVAERSAAGPAEFHILVPATRSRETRQLTAMAGDPLSGYAVTDVVGLDEAIARDRASADSRLSTFTEKLSEQGVDFSSEVGGPDPFQAISQVMQRSSFDEIIISTLPSSVSRWLRIDLPSRVRRAYSVPVVVVTVEA